MRLEDMRLFAKVAEARSFTAAARGLGMPKQTVSRRVAELEQALDVKLLHRTTRRLHLTELGSAYALRCAEVVRLAEEANRAVTDAQQVPRGTLRVTADPVFGEAFVTALVIEHARRWPEVQVEVVLTSRRVDLVEEGFDVAFRVGQVGSTELSAVALGPARVRYCASPAYVKAHGAPEVPGDLRDHQCLHVSPEGSPGRWPFRGKQGPALVPVGGRLRFNSFAMAYQAALAGLGIAICPELTCAEDLHQGRLRALLQEFTVDVGSVYLVHPTHRYLTARVRTFVELARARLARAPWTAPGRARRATAPPGPRSGGRRGTPPPRRGWG